MRKPVIVRDATEADMPAVLAIYNAEVVHGTATFDIEPRSLEAQQAWLVEHMPPYCAIVAADEGGAVIGWASLSRYRPKPAYRFTVEDTVYVRPDRQRQGVGRALLEEVLQRARTAGFHLVVGRITAGNVASIELHRALGFVEVGVEREVGYKFDRWLDLVPMQRLLGG